MDFEKYLDEMTEKNEKIKFTDLELIFKNLKSLFEKRVLLLIGKHSKNKI